VRLSSLTCRMLVVMRNVANKSYIANFGDEVGDVDFDSHKDQKIFSFSKSQYRLDINQPPI